AQAQERGKQAARDKARPSAEHLAIVDELLSRQRILDVPGHHDRSVVLDMFGLRRFTHPFDRFAQARHAHRGRERRAEADLFDEAECGTLAAYPPMADAAEMMIAMALESFERRRRRGDSRARVFPRERRVRVLPRGYCGRIFARGPRALVFTRGHRAYARTLI